MKTNKGLSLGTSGGQKEVLQQSPLQIVGNQRSGGRFGFQARRPNNQNKPGGSSGKPQTRGKRKSGPGNQGRPEQFRGGKQARQNFEQWALCNKCKRRYLGNFSDSPRRYNCGNSGHIARDYRNCQNCGKPGHLTKDCLNCYNCGKPGHFARDCPK